MSSANIDTPGGVNISDGTIHGDAFGGDKVGRDKITNVYYGEKKERLIPRMAPPAPRVFVGRDEVLRELIAALKLGEDGAGPIALTALKGMGGIGKTTLAAAFANHPEVESALPEGTLWAGLGPEPEVMSLLAEWGAQLGEDFAQLDSPEKRSRRLSTLLHDKKALLIIDDVWQAEAARHFLVGGSRCRALITTRDNEIVRKLAGHEAVRVETLTNAASLNLLHELAPKAVDADEKAANELATVLDGLPLALTLAGQMLAAEWEAGLGVAGALSELKDREARLKLAGAERAGLATTELSLRAILAMSYDRLPDDATKRAFRLLGVFGGKPLTFSIEAAAAVWGMELRPAQKMMVALVGRALVEPVDGGRYTLHTTLADFAESLLEEHSEAALARETHANYYLEFARKNSEKNWQAVEIEIGQIRRGFDWVSSMSIDKQIVLDYQQALSTFFSQRGLWDVGIRWAQVGLEVARAQGERTREAVLLNEVGSLYYNKGEFNKSLEYFERSQTIFEGIGDRGGLAESLRVRGNIYREKGLWDEAMKYFEHSLALYDEVGDRAGLARALIDIGIIYCDRGLLSEALEHYEHSRAIWEEIGDRDGLAYSFKTIGYVYNIKGASEKALEYYERCRAIWEELGHQAGLANVLNHIGSIYNNRGLWDKALEYHERSRMICDEIGDPGVLASSFNGIGSIYKNRGVWDKALEHYERSRAIEEEIGDRFGLAWTLKNLGDIYEKQERLADAEKVLNQAVVIFEEAGSRYLDDARKQLDKIRELQRSASQK
jgi:tetratricopeptide (TPR) repeat protein